MDDLKKTCVRQNEKINKLEKEILDMANKKYGEEMEKITKRLSYQEHYSRRNSLRIDGVKETPGENWEVTQYKVQRLIQKLNMAHVQLERAHRVGPKPSGRDGKGPKHRTIVARFC